MPTFTFARTADTNAYTAGDVVGPATATTAAQLFEGVGPAEPCRFVLTSVELEVDLASVPSGMVGFQLALYTATPPSAYGDNAAWDVPSGDRLSLVTVLTLNAPVTVGSTLYSYTDQINRQIGVPLGRLYAYLVTSAGYTPASGTVYTVSLHGTKV